MRPHAAANAIRLEDVMSQYMLLLYAGQADAREQQEREATLPEWMALIESMHEEGVLLGHGRLQPVETATTVRVRAQETEITDGPFATTKEILGGYFLLECADLDEALKHAARLPIARFGCVEVRPVMEVPVPAGGDRAAA
jgi:hypothetical protein